MINLNSSNKSPVSFLAPSLASLALIAGLGFSTSSQALTYTFDIDNPHQNSRAGHIDNISTQYDSGANKLTWKSTTSSHKGKLANGFWLVLSDGANPKKHHNEYSIFYGDLQTGNLTSYVYNGANSSNSWKNGEFVQSFAGAINSDYSTKGKVSYDFSIDVASINSFVPKSPGKNDWDGAQFNESIGVWYHPFVTGKNGIAYNNDGSLMTLKYGKSGWFDTAYQDAEVVDVPEPGVFALTGLGLIGMFAAHRRRKGRV